MVGYLVKNRLGHLRKAVLFLSPSLAAAPLSFKSGWVFADHFFKYPIKIGQAFETARKTGLGHILTHQQLALGMTDAILVQKGGKRIARRFFEIPAKGLFAQMT